MRLWPVVMSLTLSLCSNNCFALTPPDQDKVLDLYKQANIAMQRRDMPNAKALLQAVVQQKPANWSPFHEHDGILDIAYWDQAHFTSCVSQDAESYPNKKQLKEVNWVLLSYSRAYFLLGFIAVEEKKPLQAIAYLNNGLELEPDHPALLQETALILSETGDKQKALEFYLKSLKIKRCITKEQKAVSLRGIAVILIDLKQLDKAETLLHESLKLDPQSLVAKNELVYIEKLKQGAIAPRDGKIIRQK